MPTLATELKRKLDNTHAVSRKFQILLKELPVRGRTQALEQLEKEIHQLIKTSKKDWSHGVCNAVFSNVRNCTNPALTQELLRAYFDAIFEFWPEFSGDYDYPIKSYNEAATPSECFRKDWSMIDKDNRINKGVGLEKRQEFYDWLLRVTS